MSLISCVIFPQILNIIPHARHFLFLKFFPSIFSQVKLAILSRINDNTQQLRQVNAYFERQHSHYSMKASLPYQDSPISHTFFYNSNVNMQTHCLYGCLVVIFLEHSEREIFQRRKKRRSKQAREEIWKGLLEDLMFGLQVLRCYTCYKCNLNEKLRN